ncbi:hypothetical protein [Tenggerimyces flavus]|uniref:Uncharacterized protein n=1 Tax=Tenggerimyces flavus TaxID=1708749 RepID=A0ABV7YIT4_9ACTN|nr:hypothetical protein [Tenggerimyces flavus]MBM7789167.1 uncharacterized protein (DUF302 family) [Tenggerimyces flavus]
MAPDKVLVDCQLRAATELFEHRWDVLVDGPLKALADWTQEYGSDLLDAQEEAQARYSRSAIE